MAQLRAALGAGERVEIAGYRLSPGMARGLEASSASLPASYGGAIILIEVRAEASATTSPALLVWAQKQIDAGHKPVLRAVQGAAFWQTQEIEVVPDLLACTEEALTCLS